MRLLLSLCLILPASGIAAEIPQGTHLLLRMTNSLSTRSAKEGDQVYLQTASPIAVGGGILIPVGSYVQGTVSLAKRSGKVKGRAELSIHLETLTLASGKSMKFEPRLASVDDNQTTQKVKGSESTVEQGSDVGKDAERIAITAGSGAALGGLTDRSWQGAGIGGAAGSAVGLATVLLTRGREVELRTGSTLDVVFERPTTIE
jgi:type IV secretion system protein VirB10